MQPRTCTLRLWQQSFLSLILSVSAVLSASAQTPEPVEPITDVADTNLSASSAHRRNRKPVSLISPAAREQFQSAPIELKIRFRRQLDAVTVSVYLNEHNVTSKFAPVSPDGCAALPCDFAAMVYPQDGLQRGQNRLRLVVREPKGSMAEGTRTFFVIGPKADAGPDQRPRVGQMVQLDGSKSLSALPLTHQWVLKRKPEGSKATLSDPSTAKPSFVPDVNGSYVAQLIVHDGHFESEPDTVSVGATPVGKLIPVETFHQEGGKYGIKVGDNFYTNSDNLAGTGLQILVLDRATLAYSDFRTYQGGTNPADAIRQYLHSIDNSKIVIISTGNAGTGFDNSTIASCTNESYPTGCLEAFGATQEFRGQVTGLIYSLIGVKGLKPGSGFQAGPPDSNLDGYLAPDSNANYTFMQRRYVKFQTKDKSQTGLTNIITVGEQQYLAPPLPAGAAGGFQVLVLDRSTLQLISNTSYSTNSGNPVPEMRRMATDLNNLANARAQDTLLMVSNIGGPNAGVQYPDIPIKQADLHNALLRWGANPYVVMLLGPNSTYSLIGQPDPAAVIEASSVITPETPAGAIRGVLNRDHRNFFGPVVSDLDLVAEVNYDLYTILGNPPVDWPQMDADGKRNAYRYLSRVSLKCQPGDTSPVCDDIRLNKYDDFSSTPSIWYTNIKNLPYPGDGNGFDETEFTAVRDQLSNEYNDLDQLFAFRTNLKLLMTENQANVALTLGSVVKNVKKSIVILKDEEPLGIRIFDGITEILEITLGEFPGVSPVISTLSGVVHFIDQLSKTQQGDPAGELNTTVGKLDEDAVAAFNQSIGMVDRIIAIIGTDWGKLESAGEHLTHNDPGWKWDGTVESHVLDAAAISLKQYYYKKLLPTVYTLTIIPSSPWQDPPKQLTCSFPDRLDTYHSLKDATPSASASFPQRNYDPQFSFRPDFYYLVQIKGGPDHYTFPPTALTDPLFALTTLNPPGQTTNLGIPKVRFFFNWPFSWQGPCGGLHE